MTGSPTVGGVNKVSISKSLLTASVMAKRFRTQNLRNLGDLSSLGCAGVHAVNGIDGLRRRGCRFWKVAAIVGRDLVVVDHLEQRPADGALALAQQVGDRARTQAGGSVTGQQLEQLVALLRNPVLGRGAVVAPDLVG